jgi:hypothetical protein
MGGIVELILSDLTSEEFIAFYLIGFAGIIIRLLIAYSNKPKDTKFQWPIFWRNASRTLASLLLLAFLVARFTEFASYLVGIKTGEAAGITPGSAFLLGFGIDSLMNMFINKFKKDEKSN